MKPAELKEQHSVGQGTLCPFHPRQQLLGEVDPPRRARFIEDIALPVLCLLTTRLPPS